MRPHSVSVWVHGRFLGRGGLVGLGHRVGADGRSDGARQGRAPGVASARRGVARRSRRVRSRRRGAAGHPQGGAVGGGSPVEDRAGPRRPQLRRGPAGRPDRSPVRPAGRRTDHCGRSSPSSRAPRRETFCGQPLAACAASAAGNRTNTSSMAITTISMLRAATVAIGRMVVIMPLRRRMAPSCFIEFRENFRGVRWQDRWHY